MVNVFVKKTHVKMLLDGYCWAFRRHLVDQGQLALIERGQWVSVYSEAGEYLGAGTFDMHSEIMLRIFTKSRQPSDQVIFYHLKVALLKREAWFDRPFYRWVYAEADGLPGCVIDRFGEYVSVALTTHGMWRLRQVLIEAIGRLISCAGMVVRFDSRQAKEEGANFLPEMIGKIPKVIPVWENDRLYFTELEQSQKTGWYYDQRANHTWVAKHVLKGQAVLDLFSYQGGFALGCALKGANVTLVDQSINALKMARYAFDHHGLQGEFVCADVFDWLSKPQALFDVVILDPPAMVTHKAHFHRGAGAYQRLIGQCLSLLRENGVFVFASCSSHVKMQHMVQWVLALAKEKNRRIRLIEQKEHDLDHPVPEFLSSMAYLKCCFWMLDN
jgi:23S rRNA (cytosine1962-C5)-methyltransferase